ncbi:hypothetical protein ABZX92_43870 [Lentzea sp. NPDC006480]|uniref:hypothetical protein n=1 Tax=Lentzea sp. NPDC006480 TaxID=3157176 RepID=UPI0033A70D91
MRKNLTGALLQLALLVIGIPVVYLVAVPFGLTAKSLLPPLGLLAACSVRSCGRRHGSGARRHPRW